MMNQRTSYLPSESSYYLLLILALAIFAILVWFWFIPHGLEYNLGVSLLTSSVFTVMTIIFLGILLNLRRKQEWRSVEKAVYGTLGWHMKNILSAFTYLLDFPSELLEMPTGINWDIAYKESLLAQAEYLAAKNVEEVKLSHTGENYLSSEGINNLNNLCQKELREISAIEMKYQRFWNPSIAVLLMQLENDLRGIIDLISLKDDFKDFLSLIAYPIHATVKDIYKIHEMRVEIYPIQTRGNISVPEKRKSGVDRKLDEILEKLAVSKVDNSFLIGFSFLSILFGLSNLIFKELLYRQILMVGAVVYFLLSFYIGYFRGALRNNWGFRIFGWVWLSLSAGVILASLIFLLILEAGLGVSPLFPYGLFLIFEVIACFVLIAFIKDMETVIPDFEKYIVSISPLLLRYLKPFVNPVVQPSHSKEIYAALLLFLSIGVVLMILGVPWSI